METPRDKQFPTRGDRISNHRLSSGRLEAFLQEKPRDGNITVMLPDCTPVVKTNRKQKKNAMKEEVKLFSTRYVSKR
ncbi:hypothetical protein KVR01_007175 [Diaporthe batatas]|uniref:uncharacterized protein n=1 Tax=Diaporthe batatas TaxID=748121 RepID=UPI001D03C7C8|nr:uncharacterized protein KVR01_007175 [Diaporthe batatas]KAG8162697.1 hypothetical protein KVR01_007175 [Diaporthe batatas]